MGWISDLISGIGDAISNAFQSLWELISSSIWDLLLGWIYEAIYGAIGDFFTMMAEMGSGLFDLPWVQGYLKLFSLFGWALFLAGFVVAIFDTAIEYQSMGHLNIKQQVMPLLYGFLAVNLFTVVPIRLYNLCISLQNVFAHDLSGIVGLNIGAKDIGQFAYTVLTTLQGIPNVLNLCFMIALGYCVIKIFFANIKRGGILLIQIAVGSLYMFSIPKGYTDGFVSWCKQVIALCLTAFLQMTLLFIGHIKDLWYGRIDPQESGIYDTIEIKEVASRKVRYRSELEKLLNDEQKELLEKYTECRSEHESLTNRACFEYGFKLGVQLIAEALHINNSHHKD